MFKYIFLFFFLYFAYQFLFKLVIPLFKASSAIKQRVNQMNDQRAQYDKEVNQQSSSQPNFEASKQAPIIKKEGEYIDFEEIK